MTFRKIFILVALLIVPTFVLAQTNIDSNTSVKLEATSAVVDAEVTSETRTEAEVKSEESEKNTEVKVEARTTTSVVVAKKTDEEKKDNLRDVANTIKEINDEAKKVENSVRLEIKNGIDKSILDIRTQADIEAYELQRAVDTTRNEIYEEVERTFKNSSNVGASITEELDVKIQAAAKDIEASLELESGIKVDLSENVRSIKNTLLQYREKIEEKRELIENRQIDLIDKDTDNDGLSDYDEVYIYGTDPEKAVTAGTSGRTDSEKIRAGIDPTSETEASIDYEDPREDEDSVISDLYVVSRVEVVANEKQEKVLKLEGTGLPNSFATIYVFSTPVIVTVKTDSRGEWSYTMDKELEDGEHNVYVATVNNSGRLIARSENIPFTKTAEAAALGTFGIGEPNSTQDNFIQENFILVILAILLAALVVTLMLTGIGKEEEIVVESDSDNNVPPQPTV